MVDAARCVVPVRTPPGPTRHDPAEALAVPVVR
jgi:hypothetical protein